MSRTYHGRGEPRRVQSKALLVQPDVRQCQFALKFVVSPELNLCCTFAEPVLNLLNPLNLTLQSVPALDAMDLDFFDCSDQS